MECPECGTQNPPEAKFCLNCGARLALTCAHCGAALPPHAKFCFECGARVAAPAVVPPPEQEAAYVEALQRLVPKEFAERLRATRGRVTSERRMVTILFSDVKGSTALAESLDPEDVMEVMQGAFEILIAPIYRHEGTVARLMGDAILAFFGAPIAHEDDPDRATRAALEIVAGAREYGDLLERERGIGGFNVRVGINTGLVVTGEVGSDLRVEYTAIGDAINTAARMEQNAPPGGILIAHETYRHVRGVFDVQPQDPLLVKGKAEPIQTYMVQRAKPRAFRLSMRGVEGIETSLAGRGPELLFLQDAYQDVLSDVEARVVTIVGEAGVGKSRLLEELSSWVELRPERVWYLKGQAAAATQAVPYSLWRDLFAHRFSILESDSASTALAKFRHGMAPALEPSRADLVGHLVGFDFSASDAVRAWLGDPNLAPVATAHLASYIRSLLALGPIVAILEDLQWADDSSLDLLARLVTEIPDARMFVVGAARPALYERRPSWGEGEAAYSHLELKPLSKRASRALVADILKLVPDLPRELRDIVVDGAEGNPFYVEELIKMLIEDDVIVPGEGAWHVSLDRLAQVRVPPSLTAVLQARLDALPESERAVVQRASVVGREFWDQLVGQLASDAVAEGEVGSLLGSLRERELVFRRERTAFSGTKEYTFKHLVLRDVAYESVLRKLRRRYHAQVAGWLEAQAGERRAEYLGLIAGHYALAGETELALEYLLQAGDRARGLGGYREAARHYEQALVILKESGDLQRAARTSMKLGLTCHSAFQFERARKAYEDSFVLRKQAGEMQASEAQIAALEPAPHALRLTSMTVRTLGPHVCDGETLRITAQLFSGLVALTPDLSVEPDIARTWDVLEGGRKFVFHLRDDVVWSDGVPVTAGDFEYAWKRVLNPATHSPVADFIYDVRGAQSYHQGILSDPDQVGVHAQDEQTLVVELEGPTGYFLQLLTGAQTWPVPRHVVDVLGDAWAEPGNIVTNGAFRLGERDLDRMIVLDRSPTYHGRHTGNVQRVVLTLQEAPTRLLEAYEEDALDLVSLLRMTPEHAYRAGRLHADEVISTPIPWTTYIAFDAGRPPFDDRRVRRAFALAIDRRRLAEVVQIGLWFPATGGLVPPGMPGHSPGIALPYDPERARSLLADAGYPDGRAFPPVECVAAINPSFNPVLEYLEASWLESLGVGLGWTRIPWAAMQARLSDPLPPQAWPEGWQADYVDADNFLRVAQWRQKGRWLNEEYDGLVETARRALDPDQRVRMYQQADRILVEEAPIVPLIYRRANYLVKPWVRVPPIGLQGWHWKDFIIEPH